MAPGPPHIPHSSNSNVPKVLPAQSQQLNGSFCASSCCSAVGFSIPKQYGVPSINGLGGQLPHASGTTKVSSSIDLHSPIQSGYLPAEQHTPWSLTIC